MSADKYDRALLSGELSRQKEAEKYLLQGLEALEVANAHRGSEHSDKLANLALANFKAAELLGSWRK